MDENRTDRFNQIVLKIDNLSSKVDRLASQKPAISKQIKRFWQLKKDGALTQEEFDEQKARLLQSAKHGESGHPKSNCCCCPTEERYQSANRVKKSEVPPMTDFLRPILCWAKKRSTEFTSREAEEAMAAHFKLSDKAKKELTLGGLNRVENRTGWSITHLKAAGLLIELHDRTYEITQAGRDEACSSDERMTTTYLLNKFPAYRRWRNKDK